jgi:hypothetical protein
MKLLFKLKPNLIYLVCAKLLSLTAMCLRVAAANPKGTRTEQAPSLGTGTCTS